MFTDLGRPPLSAPVLRSALLGPGALWREVQVVGATGSTNDDLVQQAERGAAEGTVRIAEFQQSGRGRQDRTWVSPPQAGIHLSVVLRPRGVATERWGWTALLAGVAVVDALAPLVGVPVSLKWPNDILLGDHHRKAGGILAQVADGAVVLGIGLNVTTRAEELPVPTATSLAVEGASCVDRTPLVVALLRSLAQRYQGWIVAGGDADRCGLRQDVERSCVTLRREVAITLPGSEVVRGTAVSIDEQGSLVVRAGRGENRAFSAGDVVHLRPATS